MPFRHTQSAAITALAAILLACPTMTSEVARAGAPAETGGGNGVLSILPASSTLSGRRATAQLVATERGPGGSVEDQTRSVEWVSSNSSVASVTPKGRVIPKSNGTATIVARKGSLEASTTVKVVAMEQPAQVSFRRDVIPSFSQAGCNTGACHGTPTGKGGFKLSLRGYLPDQDFALLSREVAGRRINPMAPETSLILRKPLGQILRTRAGCGSSATRNLSNSFTTGSRKGRKTTPRPRRRSG